MHPDMLYPLLIMIAGLYCLFALLLLLHTRSEILVRERGVTKWGKRTYCRYNKWPIKNFYGKSIRLCSLIVFQIFLTMGVGMVFTSGRYTE